MPMSVPIDAADSHCVAFLLHLPNPTSFSSYDSSNIKNACDHQQRRLASHEPLLSTASFDESTVVALIAPYIETTLNILGGAEVISQDTAREGVAAAKEGEGWKGAGNIVESAEPGSPGVHFWSKV